MTDTDRALSEITPSQTSVRVDAVDALRGLAVLMYFASVYGARCVFALPQSAVVDVLRTQLRPSAWHGVTMADLCLPAFLFVAGLSLALSEGRRTAAGESQHVGLISRALRRGLELYAIGCLVEGVFSASGPRMAWTGPLQQLAACIVLGAFVACLLRHWPSRLMTGATLLIVYGALLAWCPFPGGDESRYEFDRNLAAFIDSRLLPGSKYFGDWDSWGIMTTIPAGAILLSGLAAGTYFLRGRDRLFILPASKVDTSPTSLSREAERLNHGRGRYSVGIGLSVAGLACVNFSVPANHVQPWNPHLSTPAFALAAIGVMLLALVLCLGCEQTAVSARCTVPLRVLGRNSLSVVIAVTAFPLTALSDSLISGSAAIELGGLAPLCRLLIEFAAVYVPAHVLFHRGRFLTV